ncbi:EH signature domain-containing protein [Psychrosphaera sp. 1_MG-2023]|uniref:EH signature domain-containing protein n=1 Tax=Psychrosphaera sp. 1_MG-2023 TaxID=3062643 RepID=UPI0026E35D4B|nr:EH signature domain-containing protein [Psychrosphaera sp. 1_MG-2023]MDO6718705.1 EH signature domain-containing protein [Psychrosphaera sp. 1_MG-2023]
MRINISKLKFTLPENPFGKNADKMRKLVSGLQQLAKGAGTESESFKAAWLKIANAIEDNKNLESVIKNKLDIRALGFELDPKFNQRIALNERVLQKIDSITDNPSSIFIESLFQYYLSHFSELKNIDKVSAWLVKSRAKRRLSKWYDPHLLSPDGPKWVAQQAIDKNADFEIIIKELDLDQFQSGQFMEQSQRIYFVEQLNNIPINQPHELLEEVQKQEVYESSFSRSELLGHIVLKVLIERAPTLDIHESWMNTIMSIAGDPRITVGHPRYIKWWSHIPDEMISKVKGWLSGLDLKLFLEALEDFSYSSRDADMERMFPARKQFLEGLYDKKLIKNTKLYMCKNMARFLNNKYKEEHLPDFSIVEDGEKSIIYVDLGNAHIIEGSHQCQLWIYRSMHESAPVLKYEKQKKSYRGLTMGLHEAMSRYGKGAYDHFVHSPGSFSWQRRAVRILSNLGVPVTVKDVLTADDYRSYVRRFGAE